MIRFHVNRSSPVFNKYSTVFEGMFDTDVPGIQGYKRLVDIEGRSEGGATLTTRFMLILYQNRTDQSWRVMTFAKSQDTDEAVDYFRKAASQEKEDIAYSIYILGLSSGFGNSAANPCDRTSRIRSSSFPDCFESVRESLTCF